jgi:hypothetical protein
LPDRLLALRFLLGRRLSSDLLSLRFLLRRLSQSFLPFGFESCGIGARRFLTLCLSALRLLFGRRLSSGLLALRLLLGRRLSSDLLSLRFLLCRCLPQSFLPFRFESCGIRARRFLTLRIPSLRLLLGRRPPSNLSSFRFLLRGCCLSRGILVAFGFEPRSLGGSLFANGGLLPKCVLPLLRRGLRHRRVSFDRLATVSGRVVSARPGIIACILGR